MADVILQNEERDYQNKGEDSSATPETAPHSALLKERETEPKYLVARYSTKITGRRFRDETDTD
jgi:hypothetical protein